MKIQLKQIKQVFPLIILPVILTIFCPNLDDACAQAARDIPPRLKTGPGVEAAGKYLFATGIARVEVIADHTAKAFEFALKKSRLRAMQLIRAEASCGSLLDGFAPELRLRFLTLLCDAGPQVRVEGLTVVKQWKTRQAAFTTVAVPLESVEDIACPYHDLASAISNYLDSDAASLDDLAFLMAYLPRHTGIYQKTRERVGNWFQQHGMISQARCFHDTPIHKGAGVGDVSVPAPARPLLLQWRSACATSYMSKAEQASKKGEWDNAVANAGMALDLIPEYSSPYIILSDVFRRVIKRPALALCAAEKAMRDGSVFYEALGRMIKCLREMKSPEYEVYEYLYQQAEVVPRSSGLWFARCPSSWESELDRLGDYPVRNLVVWSLGNAFEGKSSGPGPAYRKAAELYAQARDNSQVKNVLALLLDASEHDPFSAETYNLIGACYRHLGNPSVALPFLWQALKLRPDYDLALTNLGLCCKELKLMQAAGYYFSYDAVKNSSNAWVRESYEGFMQ